MTQTKMNGGRTSLQIDAAWIASSRKLITRLPITMRPSLYQQLTAWHSLFPFEQNQLRQFLLGWSCFSPPRLKR